MRFFNSLMLSALLLLGSPALAADPKAAGAKSSTTAKPSSTNSERPSQPAAQDWGNHLAQEIGVLINPPIGSLSPEVQKTQKLLQDLVEKLAGEDFAKRRASWVVTIYANSSPNAFAIETTFPYGLKNYQSKLYRNKERKDQKIYEIGVTTGLLNMVSSIDELSFVLAHEIAHLLESHTKNKTSGNRWQDIKNNIMRWWSTQQLEGVADYLAIQRMAGKYNLQASISILEKLAKLHVPSFMDTYNAATSDHHHEGPRLALAQATVEDLQRSDLKNQIHTLTPAPSYIKLKNVTRLHIPEKRSAYFDKKRKDLMEWLRSGAITEEKNIRQRFNEDTDQTWPKKFAGFDRLDNHLSNQQYAEALMEGLQVIEQSGRTGHQKISEFLLFQMSLKDLRYYETELWEDLKADDLRKIKLFLTKHTEGKNGWSGPRFLNETLSALSGSSISHFLYEIYGNFLDGESGIQQKALADVAKIKPQAWADFWKAYIHAQVYAESQTADIAALSSWLQDVSTKAGSKKSFWEMTPLLQQLTLELVQSTPTQEWSRSMPLKGYNSGTMAFYQVLNIIQMYETDAASKTDLEFVQKLKKTFAPLAADYVQWRDNNVERFFDIIDPKNIQSSANFLNSFFASLEAFPVSVQNLPKIQKAFIKIAHEYVHKNILNHHTSQLSSTESSLQFMGSLLANKSFSAEERLDVFRLLLNSTEENYTRIPKNLSSTVQNQIYSYIEELGAQKLLKFMHQDYLPLTHYYQYILEKYYQTKSTDANYMDLIKKTVENEKFDAVADDLLSKSRHPYRNLGMQYASQIYANSRLSIFTFLSMNSERGVNFLASLRAHSFNELLNSYLKINRNKAILQNFWASNLNYKYAEKEPGNIQHAELFLKKLFQLDSQISSLREWRLMYKKILKIHPVAVNRDAVLRKNIQSKLTARMQNLSGTEAYEWFKDRDLFRLLEGEFVNTKLLAYLKESMDFKNIPALREKIKEIDRRLTLQKNYPEIYSFLQKDLSVAANLQPANVSEVFPGDKKKSGSLTKQTSGFQAEIRGLSYLVARIRKENRDAQLAFLEYISGRSGQMPGFILKNDNSEVPLDSIASTLRERLQRENRIGRIMTMNAFLAGPNSFIHQDDGEKFIIDYLLKDVRQENRDFAELMAKAILHAQGSSKSLAVSYILGQPVEAHVDISAREGQVLTNLFNAFGVPGVKLGQYLAFTSQLQGYTKAMQALQDSAGPISYFEMLHLIKNRFGQDWPSHYRVEKILGSGSVNIAVEYEDLRTGRHEVAQISRKQIEIGVNEDFRKFSLSLDYVLKDPHFGPKMSFIKGLLGIIQQSVALEFNKEHVYKMQEFAMGLYNTEVRGWKVQTIKASEHRNMTVFMQKAPGRSARKILNEKPEVYRETMGILGDIEWNILMGMKVGDKSLQLPLFANPDFHDGQVLIDEASRTITILDFGQALTISNQERAIAVELVKIISLSQSHARSLQIINHLLSSANSQNLMTKAELQKLLASGDRMDIFIRLLADVQLRGYTTPLSAVHWVLALNRMLSLSEKIETNKMTSLKMLMLYQKIGLNIESYNWTRRSYDKVKNFFSSWSRSQETAGAPSCSSVFAR